MEPQTDILTNRYYTDAERYKREVDALVQQVKPLLDTPIDENTNKQLLSDLYSKIHYYQEAKPRAGRRLIADIVRDVEEITCAKTIKFVPLPPDGMELSGSFKNLVFVDKVYRLALRLPIVYFQLSQTKYGVERLFYTSIRNGYVSYNFPDHRRYMAQPHCRVWRDACFGDFEKPIETAMCSYDPKTAVPILRDFLCAGGGHRDQIRHLQFGDHKIRFYSLDEMRIGHQESGLINWCATYSRWGLRRNMRFYISPNEWLPIVEGMTFTETNATTKFIPCESLKRPMPDVKHLVQFDPTITWKRVETGVTEMWRYPLYTPQWKVRLAGLEREKLSRRAKELLAPKTVI